VVVVVVVLVVGLDGVCKVDRWFYLKVLGKRYKVELSIYIYVVLTWLFR
jgi:hypothetical protein